MKTLITVVGVAVLAIVLLESSLINAQRQRPNRCREDRRPPLNSDSDVKCRRPNTPGHFFQTLACIRRCLNCYNRTELGRQPGCLVKNKCNCLANRNSSSTVGPGIETTPLGDIGQTTGLPELPGGGSTSLPELPGGGSTSLPELPGGGSTSLPELPGGDSSSAPELPGGGSTSLPELPGGDSSSAPELPVGNSSPLPETPVALPEND